MKENRTNTVKPKNKKTKASDIIILALFAFLSLQILPIANYLIVWTPLIDKVKLDDRLWTVIMHAVCVGLWIALALWLAKLSKKECNFPIVLKESAPSLARLGLATAVTVVFSALMIIFAGGFSLPYEPKGAVNILCIAEQYIFLAFNAAVFVLVMIFGQKFGDLAFKKKNIPWGGMVLGVGMAVTNLISGLPSIGEEGAVWSVLISAVAVFLYATVYGVIFVITEKKPLYAWPFVAIIFILL